MLFLLCASRKIKLGYCCGGLFLVKLDFEIGLALGNIIQLYFGQACNFKCNEIGSYFETSNCVKLDMQYIRTYLY